MTSRSHVVIGYDFSVGARPALHRAAELAAGDPGVVLHVVCVVDPERPIPSIASYDGVHATYVARVQEALAAEVHHELEAFDIAHPVHLFVHARLGRGAARAILDLADEVGAERIVVGSRRDADDGRGALGATAAELARAARCSVELARGRRYAVDAIVAPAVALGPEAVTYRYEYRDHRLSLRPPEWPVV